MEEVEQTRKQAVAGGDRAIAYFSYTGVEFKFGSFRDLEISEKGSKINA